MKKYNYIYVIVNLINNKKYVGKHSTDDLNDNYFGSGRILKESIKKHGLPNFKKNILEFEDDIDKLDEAEIKWIKKLKTYTRKGGYNLTMGGTGGDTFNLNEEKKKEKREKMSKIMKEKWQEPEFKRIRIESMRGHKKSKQMREKLSRTKIGVKMSESHFQNMKKAMIKVAERKRKNKEPYYNERSVTQYTLDGIYIETYKSLAEAGRDTGMTNGSIMNICKGKIKKPRKFLFKYAT
jgi:group I intron endonuclease